MAGPLDADYVCRLDEKSAKKALDELNEDPRNRLGAVETFRQWIKQQPHISCPTDISFLLLFLRVRYFSQLEARKLLENFLSRRGKFPQWFRNLDSADPKIQAAFDTGVFLLLPERDDEGRQVILMRPGRLNLNSKVTIFTKVDLFRAYACIIDLCYLCDEMTTVNGTVTILDFGGFSLTHNSYVTIEERRDFVQTWQANYPARVKQLHIYNTGPAADFILSIIKLVVPEKILQRVKRHGQLLESLYNDVPQRLLPVEYLPDDYSGPNAGTERQIIDRMKSLLASPEVRARIQYLSQDKWGIDETKRPSAADSVPTASFRRLAVD